MKFNEDYLKNDILTFSSFGEYRKGSTEFGPIIHDIMTFLRNYNSDKNILLFKIKNIPLDIKQLNKLNNFKYKKKLFSIEFKFLDKDKKEIDNPDVNGYILFSNLGNKTNEKPWENNTIV